MTEDWREVLKDIGFMLFSMAGTFCIINVAWYWGIKTRYDDAIYDLYRPVFTEWENPEAAQDGMYEIVEDGYRYRVYETSYLKSKGYICISAESGWIDETERPDQMSAEDGTNVILNIGFRLFSEYSFQVDIENENGRFQIELDKYGKLVTNIFTKPEYKKKMNGILSQNREEIDCLFYLADERWNIG